MGGEQKNFPGAKPELLAPAGNRECFDAALRFGADAVYLAGKNFGLRAAAANFSDAELTEAVKQAHALHKKVYVTVNALFKNEEFARLPGYLSFLKEIGADAVILSDPGALEPTKNAGLNVHISTQMSTMNHMSASFWHRQGAKRIVLARELSLEEIADIRVHTPPSLELEAFVHGAMCVAHSGRCILSSVLTGRSGNRGECAQPCRWGFSLVESGYPGEYFPIFEEGQNTFILNSKDLMMIEHIPELIRAGITSFKIEGRMKSPYYVASVLLAYRRAIDSYALNRESYRTDPRLVEELLDCGTRGFCTGFYFGSAAEASDIYRLPQTRRYNVCAVVREGRNEEGMLLAEQRNKFSVGDTLSALSPEGEDEEFVLEKMKTPEGEEKESAPHPQELVYIDCPFPLEPGDMLRVKNRAEAQA